MPQQNVFLGDHVIAAMKWKLHSLRPPVGAKKKKPTNEGGAANCKTVSRISPSVPKSPSFNVFFKISNFPATAYKQAYTHRDEVRL